MNNSKTDCSRLETAFLEYRRMLGNNNKDSPLWYWLFESALKCNEYEIARKIIRKMSAKTEISAIVALAVESKKARYLEEAIRLAYEKIEEKNNLGYHILMKIIKVMAETEEKELNERAFEEAKKITDDIYKEKAINIILISTSTAIAKRAKTMERLTPEKDKTLEEMFYSVTMATKAIVVASKV